MSDSPIVSIEDFDAIDDVTTSSEKSIDCTGWGSLVDVLLTKTAGTEDPADTPIFKLEIFDSVAVDEEHKIFDAEFDGDDLTAVHPIALDETRLSCIFESPKRQGIAIVDHQLLAKLSVSGMTNPPGVAFQYSLRIKTRQGDYR